MTAPDAKGSSTPPRRKRCPRLSLHEEHQWSEGRFRVKTWACPGEQPAPPSMYKRLYEESREVILSVWRLHSQPTVQPDTPGFGPVDTDGEDR